MKKLFFFILLVTASGRSLFGQDLISVTPLSNLNQGLVGLLFNSVGIQATPSSGVNTFKIQYTTLGTDMAIDTASGLLMLPDEIEGPLPMAIYQHATTSGRSDVPSNLDGTYELGAAFASLGMAVLAPDYLGMGDSRGFHPYLYGQTEGQAAVDMLQAIEEYMIQNELESTSHLFIMGYSQGGQATMAAHRLIEEQYADQYTVTASLPMSGPYNLSDLLRPLRYLDVEYLYPGYLVYNTLGLRAIDPTLFGDASELFKEEFLPPIRQFEQTGEDLFNGLNLAIIDEMQFSFGEIKPRFMFRDSMLDIFENNPSHPLNVILEESDYFNWVPNAPVRMTYCPDDDQVDFRNAVIADSVMNSLGAEDVDAIDVSSGRVLDHTGCIVPSLNFGIPWILSFLDNTVPTEDQILEALAIRVYPSPASDIIRIELEEGTLEQTTIYRIDALSLDMAATIDADYVIDVSQIPSGVYLLDIRTSLGRVSRKVIIQH